jgi:hypothetical protein
VAVCLQRARHSSSRLRNGGSGCSGSTVIWGSSSSSSSSSGSSSSKLKTAAVASCLQALPRCGGLGAQQQQQQVLPLRLDCGGCPHGCACCIQGVVGGLPGFVSFCSHLANLTERRGRTLAWSAETPLLCSCCACHGGKSCCCCSVCAGLSCWWLGFTPQAPTHSSLVLG